MEGDSVTSDHQKGAYLGTCHLIELGHRRIAAIIGPMPGPSAVARLRGFERAMQSARLSVPKTFVQQADFNKGAGHQKASVLLAMKNRPTAIFAANDLIAFGVLASAGEMGLQCPKDLSLVGFDNLDDSDVTVPALTTVDQFAYTVGAQAAHTVVERMQGRSAVTRHILLVPELRIKQSTAPPAANRETARSRRSA